MPYEADPIFLRCFKFSENYQESAPTMEFFVHSPIIWSAAPTGLIPRGGKGMRVLGASPDPSSPARCKANSSHSNMVNEACVLKITVPTGDLNVVHKQQNQKTTVHISSSNLISEPRNAD